MNCCICSKFELAADTLPFVLSVSQTISESPLGEIYFIASATSSGAPSSPVMLSSMVSRSPSLSLLSRMWSRAHVPATNSVYWLVFSLDGKFPFRITTFYLFVAFHLSQSLLLFTHFCQMLCEFKLGDHEPAHSLGLLSGSEQGNRCAVNKAEQTEGSDGIGYRGRSASVICIVICVPEE